METRADRLEALKARLRNRDIVGLWSTALAEELQHQESQRDPAFIEQLVPLMELFGRYFDGEVRHRERIPRTGPVLLAGNHSGGAMTPDTSLVIAAWYRTRGFNDPLSLMAADALFGVPALKGLMRKLGAMPASPANAERALRQGSSLLLYPGGAHEMYRSWRDRNRIDFAHHTGFVRLALRTGVPVVPVVGHGAQESSMVLSRGEGLARLIGMNRVRLGIFPIILQFPWGISSPVLPGVPLPVKVTVEICEPLDWKKLGPDAADDPTVVQRCFDEVTTIMQDTLTRLAQEQPHPLLSRLGTLIRRPR